MRATGLRWVIGAIVLSQAGWACAEGWSQRAPVEDAALAEVRGGFTGPDGTLQIAFGVQRSVYVNGALAASGAAGSLLVVQQGLGNAVAGVTLPATGTVLQNSADGQDLRTVTVLDVTVNSLKLTKSIDLQLGVAGAIAASLRR